MNPAMIGRLVLKDWHLLRWPILGYLVAGGIALLLVGTGGDASFYAGSILLLTVVISVGIHLAMATVVEERTHQTLPFVMSLPISPAEFTAAKVLANLSIFLVPWTAFLIGALAVMSFRPGFPHGLVPFGVIVLNELFLGYVLTFAAALVSESMGWTIGAMIAANLSLQGIMYVLSNNPSFEKTMHGTQVVWTQPAIVLVCAQILAVAGLIGLTFFFQSRKRDFV